MPMGSTSYDMSFGDRHFRSQSVADSSFQTSTTRSRFTKSSGDLHRNDVGRIRNDELCERLGAGSNMQFGDYENHGAGPSSVSRRGVSNMVYDDVTGSWNDDFQPDISCAETADSVVDSWNDEAELRVYRQSGLSQGGKTRKCNRPNEQLTEPEHRYLHRYRDDEIIRQASYGNVNPYDSFPKSWDDVDRYLRQRMPPNEMVVGNLGRKTKALSRYDYNDYAVNVAPKSSHKPRDNKLSGCHNNEELLVMDHENTLSGYETSEQRVNADHQEDQFGCRNSELNSEIYPGNDLSTYQNTVQPLDTVFDLQPARASSDCERESLRLPEVNHLSKMGRFKKSRPRKNLSDIQFTLEDDDQNNDVSPSNTSRNAARLVNGRSKDMASESDIKLLNTEVNEANDGLYPEDRKTAEERRRNRLPSLTMFDIDLSDLSPRLLKRKLFQCQMRHKRVFAKTLINVRKKELLPSNKKNLLEWEGERCLGAWKRNKREMTTHWNAWSESLRSRFGIWHRSIKCIEGAYGSGVVAYFLFVRRLFFLNLLAFIPLALFVIVPQVDGKKEDIIGEEKRQLQYRGNWSTSNIPLLVLDFLQGTGWMENSFLFYGHYSSSPLKIGNIGDYELYYTLPLAYFVVSCIAFMLSLQRMARHIATGYRVLILEFDSRRTKYTNLVLHGWDYALNNVKMVNQKHCSLFLELSALLIEDKERERKARRTGRNLCKLTVIRFSINVIVLSTLAGSAYAIYQAVRLSVQFRKRPDYESLHLFVQLIIEYLPSLTITGLNLVVPTFFDVLSKAEDLSPEVNIHISLARIVFLRLASLAVLIGTLYVQIFRERDGYRFHCWETYVGQQLYKLVSVDFGVVFAKVSFDFIRR